MSIKIITKNKRAYFDYELLLKVEAGLVLQGTEVKSLRAGKAQINEAFVNIDHKNEAWIHNMSIPPYSHGNRANHPEKRKRKLLLNKKQINTIQKEMHIKGLTLIPTILYFKKSLAKIEIVLARGKKAFDKRQDAMKKSVEKKLQKKDYS